MPANEKIEKIGKKNVNRQFIEETWVTNNQFISPVVREIKTITTLRWLFTLTGLAKKFCLTTQNVGENVEEEILKNTCLESKLL